jgi:hypothetical protein
MQSKLISTNHMGNLPPVYRNRHKIVKRPQAKLQKANPEENNFISKSHKKKASIKDASHVKKPPYGFSIHLPNNQQQ